MKAKKTAKDFAEGDCVRIKRGPYEGVSGKIAHWNHELKEGIMRPFNGDWCQEYQVEWHEIEHI